MVIIIVLTVFLLFRAENKLKAHENICKIHDYCYIEMPE